MCRNRRWREPRSAVPAAATLVLAATAAFAAAPACRPDSAPPSAEAALETVAACRAESRLADAVPSLRRWLSRRPDDHPRRLALAELLTELGDLEGAAVEYERLLAVPGARQRAVRKARADVLAWSGRLDEAIAEYRRLVDEDARDAPAWLGLGLALGWQGDPGASEAALRQALRVEPGNAEAARALDALLASPAWQAWRAEQARAAAPDEPSRWADAIAALVAAERWWDAEPLAAQATRRWPDDEDLARLARDLEDRRRRRLAAALAAAHDRVARDPDDRAARLEVAGTLAVLGDHRAAQAEYERAHARWPDDEEIVRALARQASYAGDTGRALALYARLVAAYPDDAALRIERARVLGWDGQLEESAAEFARLRKSAPAAASRGLADSYRWAGHRGMASRYYRDAARLDPGGEDGQAADVFFSDDSGRLGASGGWSWLRASDDFRRWRLGAEGTLRLGVATEVALGVAHMDYAQYDDALAAERPRLSLATDLWPRLRVALAYGPNVYRETVTHAGAIELTGILGPETTLALAYDHYDIVDEVLTLASVLPDPRDPDREEPIESHRLRLAGRTVLPWRLELAANAALAWYDDANRLTQLGASLGRRLLRRPDLRVAWDVSYLSYAARSVDRFGRSRYWDPPDYLSNGLTLHARHAVRERIRLAVDGRVGWGTERGRGALERAAGAGIELEPVTGLTLECAARWGQTQRTGGAGDGYTVWSAWVTLRWQWERS